MTEKILMRNFDRADSHTLPGPTQVSIPSDSKMISPPDGPRSLAAASSA